MIDWLASLVILLASLHNMESLKPTATGLSSFERVSEFWRAAGWILLAGDAYANIIQPFVEPMLNPQLHEGLALVGIAMLLAHHEVVRRGQA